MSEKRPLESAPIAFFDLDLTLLWTNSAHLWLRRARRKKKVSKRFLVKGAFWLLLYRLGVSRLERVLEKGVASLQGLNEAELERSIHEFWEEEVSHTLRDRGREAIKKHHERGERCVLLTSSSVYIARHAQRELGLDDIVSTVFEVTDGHLTGRTKGPMCYGDGKLSLAKAYADQYKTPLSECAFYTDSYSDVSVLEQVGRPVVVNPDPRLKRFAQRKGWPVVDWDESIEEG